MLNGSPFSAERRTINLKQGLVAVIAEKTNAPQCAFLKAISKESDITPPRSAVAQMEAREEFLAQPGRRSRLGFRSAGEHGRCPFPFLGAGFRVVENRLRLAPGLGFPALPTAAIILQHLRVEAARH